MSDNGRGAESVTLTIDGAEVSVPRGTTLLDAAQAQGADVPHYCYHPGLSAPAQCRACLVEVEGTPKLQPSCVTPAQDGQVVRTDGPEARKMRQGVLEFYLVNHPLDCPICDMSGECKLQDYVFAEGRERGRGREPKRVFGVDDFGGDVLYYGDRCVMCTRCVRFMDEVARDSRLTVVDRGNRSVIDTFFDQGLEGSPFAGNVVDVCPVGALVSKDFLHKARAWDLDHTPSVCPGCAQGCNVELHTRDDQVQRLKPRANLEVNGHWMCDHGREDYHWMNRPDRLEVPLVGRASEREETDWESALARLFQRARAVAGGEVRIVGSARASNEALTALLALGRELGTVVSRVVRSPRAEREIPLPGFPTLKRRRDLVPNLEGAVALGYERVGDDAGAGGLEDAAGRAGAILALGDELADQPPDFGADADLFVYLGSADAPAARSADFVLPVATFAEEEGTFVNAQGRVQRYWPGLRPPGSARPAWMVLGALAAALRGEAGPASAAEAFLETASAHAPFAGLTYEALGEAGRTLETARG